MAKAGRKSYVNQTKATRTSMTVGAVSNLAVSVLLVPRIVQRFQKVPRRRHGHAAPRTCASMSQATEGGRPGRIETVVPNGVVVMGRGGEVTIVVVEITRHLMLRSSMFSDPLFGLPSAAATARRFLGVPLIGSNPRRCFRSSREARDSMRARSGVPTAPPYHRIEPDASCAAVSRHAAHGFEHHEEQKHA